MGNSEHKDLWVFFQRPWQLFISTWLGKQLFSSNCNDRRNIQLDSPGTAIFFFFSIMFLFYFLFFFWFFNFQRLLRRTLHSLVSISGHSMVSRLYTVLSLTPFPSFECIHLLSWYYLWPRPKWNATLSSSSSLAVSLTISLYFTHGPELQSHYRWVPYSPEVFDERQWGLFMQHHPQDQFLSQYISSHFSFSLIFMQSPN